MAKIDPKATPVFRGEQPGPSLSESDVAARLPAAGGGKDSFEPAASNNLSRLLGAAAPNTAEVAAAVVNPKFVGALGRIAEAYGSQGLQDLAQMARDLAAIAGAPAGGGSLTDLGGTSGLHGSKSAFGQAFDRFREKQSQAQEGAGGLGMLDGLPRNSHAAGAPGVGSRPTPGSADLRTGNLAGQDGVIRIPPTYFRSEENGGHTAWTHRNGPNGSLITDMETTNPDGSRTLTQITNKADGTTVVEREYYGPEGESTGGSRDVFTPDGEPGEGESWSQDPDSAPPNTDDWLVRAMLALAARINPPKGDVAMPVHVNPGPEGATPQPTAPRLRPGAELVTNPSPDDLGSGGRPLDAETAERLRGTLKPPVQVNPPGPGEE